MAINSTLCIKCKVNLGMSRGRNVTRHELCFSCLRRPHRVTKGNYCEKCGFVAKNKCQLDVDHIDGNHSNNSSDNLQTLCANCHRLKTYLNRDYQEVSHDSSWSELFNEKE